MVIDNYFFNCIILAIWAIAKLLYVYDNNNKPDTEQTALYSPEFNLVRIW